MDTKRLVRAYTTVPMSALFGTAVGTAAGALFAIALAIPYHWLSGSVADAAIGIPLLGFCGGVAGAFAGCVCGLIGGAFGGLLGWGIGGFVGAAGVATLVGWPTSGLDRPHPWWSPAVPGAVGLACGVAIGLAIRSGWSGRSVLSELVPYLHDWDHLVMVCQARTPDEAEALRERLRAHGLAPVITGADLDAVARLVGRRQPIRIHVPERHAAAATEVLAAPAVATELEAASPPEGVGTELEAAGAPEGRGDEPMADGDGPRELPPRLLGGPG